MKVQEIIRFRPSFETLYRSFMSQLLKASPTIEAVVDDLFNRLNQLPNTLMARPEQVREKLVRLVSGGRRTLHVVAGSSFFYALRVGLLSP
jgi:hypothetical protein